MKRSIPTRKILYWSFCLLGLLLFYLAFRNIPFNSLKTEIATVRPVYLLLLLIPSWGGQVLRTWRWQLLLGKKAGFLATYHSLLFGYFVNLALPRVGEISRCAALHSVGGPSFGKNLGTVVVERITDVFFLLLVVVLAFLLQSFEIRLWMDERVFLPLRELIQKNHLGIILGLLLFGGILIVGWLIYREIAYKLHQRFQVLLVQITEGFRSILSLNIYRLLLYSLLSLAIWAGYFFTTWLWFQALPAASSSSFGVAFTVMVVGSLVKTLPIQGGGAGAYHLVIGELLTLYGMGGLSSKTFALLNHGYQTLFYILFGGFSAIWVAWRKQK